jgi:hypothetical protein
MSLTIFTWMYSRVIGHVFFGRFHMSGQLGR